MERTRIICVFLLALATGAAAAAAWAEDWPQWGGAHRNFMTESKGLAAKWPTSGPKQLWSRKLGEGYSAIVAEGGRLYTMYRKKAGMPNSGKEVQEVVIAIDTATGKTIWEYAYDAPELPSMNLEYGPGPHSTPLIAGDMLFTVGATGKFHAIKKHTGMLAWKRDFYAEYGVVWGRGYSCSPIAHRDKVIVTLGKKGRSVIAFDQKTGKVVWERHDFDYGPGSPILIRVEGTPAPAKAKNGSNRPTRDAQEQLVVFMANEIAGLDPNNGDFLWSVPHKTDWGLNISTPVWGEGNLLFCSSAYNAGSRAIELTRVGNKTTAKELWFNNRMRIHIGNAIRIGDYIYGSSGDFGPAFFAAVNVKTGEIPWRDRSFSKAVTVFADGKLVLLDEDGNLALVSVTPQGMTVHSRTDLLERNAWTVPTLVGTKLYVRDRKTIRALDLG